jgi:HK97 family phage major capsid protein
MTIESYTRQAALERMEQVHARVEELAGKHRMSKGDDAEWAELSVEFGELDRHVQKLDRCAAIAGAAGGGNGRLRLDRGINADSSDRPRSGQHSSAMRTLEHSVKAGGLAAAGAEAVERLLDAGPETERSWVSRWVTESGSNAYRSAFAKLLLHGETRAALEWTAGEREAFDRVSRLKSEQRSMSLSDSAGGFLVPFQLDPSIILTSGGSINPLLEISRVVSTFSDVYHAVSSTGTVSEWLAEAAEASDASPTLAEPTIPAYKMSVFVPFSVELQGDAVSLLNEIGRLFARRSHTAAKHSAYHGQRDRPAHRHRHGAGRWQLPGGHGHRRHDCQR